MIRAFEDIIYRNWLEEKEGNEDIFGDGFRKTKEKVKNTVSEKIYDDFEETFVDEYIEVKEKLFLTGLRYACECFSKEKGGVSV